MYNTVVQEICPAPYWINMIKQTIAIEVYYVNIEHWMRPEKMVCNYEIKDCSVVSLHMDGITLPATIASYCLPWPSLTGLFLVSSEEKCYSAMYMKSYFSQNKKINIKEYSLYDFPILWLYFIFIFIF